MATCIESVTSNFYGAIEFVKTNAPLAADYAVETGKNVASLVSSAVGPAFAALVTFASTYQFAAAVAIATIVGVTVLVVRVWNNYFNAPTVANLPRTVAEFSVTELGSRSVPDLRAAFHAARARDLRADANKKVFEKASTAEIREAEAKAAEAEEEAKAAAAEAEAAAAEAKAKAEVAGLKLA